MAIREKITRCGKRRMRLTGWVGLLSLLVIEIGQGQIPKPTEYQVKAAYLDNLGRFVEWPPNSERNAASSFTICVLGRDPFGEVLDETLAGELIDGKKTVAKRITNAQDAFSCQILFVSSSESAQVKEILAALNNRSILTVSDMPDFTRHGGMVQFVLDGARVRFELNLATAQRAGLTMSSQVLRLATNVRRNP